MNFDGDLMNDYIEKTGVNCPDDAVVVVAAAADECEHVGDDGEDVIDSNSLEFLESSN